MKRLVQILFILITFYSVGQEDKKLVYSPATTSYFYLSDAWEDTLRTREIDTSITDLHIYNYKFHDGDFFYHQGNIGTAIKPVYFKMPSKLGYDDGYDVYDEYRYKPEDITYYDTKSPYTNVKYVQGSTKDSRLDAEFSRNINPSINIGGIYRRMKAAKLIGAYATQGGKKNTESINFILYGSVQNIKNKYTLLTNFQLFRHDVNELGGIVKDSLDFSKDHFGGVSETVNLIDANSYDWRNEFNLYHDFKLAGNFLKVFHEMSLEKKRVGYRDLNAADVPSNFYFGINTTFDTLSDDSNTEVFNNEQKVGLKSSSKQHLFALYYGVHKQNINQIQPFSYMEDLSVPSRITYTKAGGDFRLYLKDSIGVGLNGEALLNQKNSEPNGTFQFNNDYKANLFLRVKKYELGYNRIMSSPKLWQAYTNNNRFTWDTSLLPQLSDQLYFKATLPFKGRKIEWTANYTNIYNYIYLDNKASIAQSKRDIALFYSMVRVRLFAWKFHLDGDYAYSKELTSTNVIRFPEYYLLNRLYVQTHFFKKVLLAQIGLEAMTRGAFMGDAYMPALQQYYIQDNFNLNNYTVFSAFFNGNFKGFVDIFLRLSHINTAVNGGGYFEVPYYTGMPFAFQFGVRYRLFD